MNILVIKPSSLGDVVHTLPAVSLLKAHWPQSSIRWVINPEWAPLLKDNPDLEGVIVFPRGSFRGPAGWVRILPWMRSMAAHRADLIIDFQGLLRSAAIGRLCRGGELVGLSDAREGSRFFYDRIVDVSEEVHAVDRYLKLVYALGVPPPSGELQWALPAGDPVAGIEPGYVILHPFSRGAGKSLSEAEVREFCAAIAPRRVIIAGRSEVRVGPLANASDLLNRTSIAGLIWLLRQADFVVSVDSGPMHIASAITPRLLSIHTWSDPAKVGPYRPEAWIWRGNTVYLRGSPTITHSVTGMSALARFVDAQIGV